MSGVRERSSRWRARNHPAWWAFLVHRLSGLALVLFLPFHFWVLGMALTDPVQMDEFLSWTDRPLVKLAEAGLVVLLAAHLLGGVRLLALEFLPWRAWHKDLLVGAAALTVLIGIGFLYAVF
jgi:fumarate reductase subunit D